MIHINEYQEFRRFKTKLRKLNILKTLKYTEGDYVVLKNGKKGVIRGINEYDFNPKIYVGNHKKDYYFLEEEFFNEPNLSNQTTIDESEIDQKESELYSNEMEIITTAKKYNL